MGWMRYKDKNSYDQYITDRERVGTMEGAFDI
jgi:hypothetical protein